MSNSEKSGNRTGKPRVRAGYTLKNLNEVEDRAPGADLGEVQELRVATNVLELSQVGFSHFRIRPGARQPFGHRHEGPEEVYLFLSGDGRVKVGDEIVEVGKLDALRISPELLRSCEAGDDGLEYIVFSRHFEADGELVWGAWEE